MNSQIKTYTKTRMLAHFLKGCTRFFVYSIITSFAVTLLEMLIPQVMRQTVDSVIGNEPFKGPAFVLDFLEKIGGAAYLRQHFGLISLVTIVLALLVSVCIYLRFLTGSIAAERLQQNIREDLFRHIQHLPFAWHMENKTGDIIQRCTSDAERIRSFVADQMISIVRIVIMVTLSMLFMFSMNVKLALIAACSIPVIIGYSAFFHGRIGDQFEKCDENEGILSTIAQENLTGVRVVRAFGREEFERNRFDKQNQHYTGLWVRLMRLLSYFWGISDFIGGIQILLMLVMGSVFCVRGEMSSGEFITFMIYNGMLIWPVRQLGRVISEMSKAGVSIDRIRYIMNSPIEQDPSDAVSPQEAEEALHGDIEFDHVTFGYEPDTTILSNVSFTIPSGTTFGILGSTGSGKSTLMHLLNRLYDLPEGGGDIRVGGVSTSKMPAKVLRKNIGMVLQEPFLFSRTIAENIGITDRDMSFEDIRTAAQIACVDDAILGFKKGYDTMVGERGVTLSGGQKQRAAIARMLTQKAPIMVFDDSLSAVDAETDAKIRSELSRFLGSSTVILISHRITTLMQADMIMVLDKGRIVEMGTPQELYEKGGTYRHIYDIQLSYETE